MWSQKNNLEDLLTDLKEYLVEDDYPTSTISNIYFDTDNFDVIQDALDGNHPSRENPYAYLSSQSQNW